MTGSASNLTLKLLLHHDELKNVNHVVARGALVEVSNPITMHWAQKVSPETCVTQPCMCIISWDTRGGGGQKKANQDSVK